VGVHDAGGGVVVVVGAAAEGFGGEDGEVDVEVAGVLEGEVLEGPLRGVDVAGYEDVEVEADFGGGFLELVEEGVGFGADLVVEEEERGWRVPGRGDGPEVELSVVAGWGDGAVGACWGWGCDVEAVEVDEVAEFTRE
jgi:hypothetical protein